MKASRINFVTFTLVISFLFCSCSRTDEKVQMKVIQYQVPVLVSKPDNPVLQIMLMPAGSSERMVREISVSLEGTSDMSDIRTLRLFSSGGDMTFSVENPFGKDMPPAPVVKFEGNLPLSDTLSLWLSAELKTSASLLNKIQASCISVKTSEGKVQPDTSFIPLKLRIGLALRKHLDDNVHTYRIPGLTTTKNGTLLAIYDIRRNSSRDLQGDIDIGLSRSTDGGNTWEQMKVVLDMKEWGGLPQKFNGVSDACILADNTTGKVFIAGLWMHGVLDRNGKWIEGLTDESDAWEHQWRNSGSQPGFGVKETSQFLVVSSSDDGVTWSEPVNITKMCKRREWWLWAPAPGHGITLKDGTLVMPTQGRDEEGKPFSNITWSRDGGITWKTGKPAYSNTTESMAAELSDGSVMLNMRHNQNRNNPGVNNGRAVAVTGDLGETWTEHPSSRNALIEPTCMGSLHRHDYTENGVKKSILLFSNPDSRTARTHMTIKVSFDDGMTWPLQNRLLLDELRSAGYSCLTSIDENTIGILYEGSQSMLTFEMIPLSELIR
ncbi:MAG TPA: exo-alpha-sialidase [Bacteroidales bacterium]|nr:exo-alpha-sialidase [Bacteroidales bacterium]HPJ58281.1 exo-alpha-sialidase [Bacteroidales bacterium]HPR10913.1 exo-alpha-sialidase [Bacteroidales bacterium]HRW84127.1 exo-alpha-sialidase [Bacteroidales bacterium]